MFPLLSWEEIEVLGEGQFQMSPSLEKGLNTDAGKINAHLQSLLSAI